MSEMETRFKEDINTQVESQKIDAESRIADAVELAKLEGKFINSVFFFLLTHFRLNELPHLIY